MDHAASQALCLDPNGGLPRLLEIMARLRDPETGCPWDIEQGFETIAPYTIEEAYEVADAIAAQDFDALISFLGNLKNSTTSLLTQYQKRKNELSAFSPSHDKLYLSKDAGHHR